jgi:hypothetical protein
MYRTQITSECNANPNDDASDSVDKKFLLQMAISTDFSTSPRARHVFLSFRCRLLNSCGDLGGRTPVMKFSISRKLGERVNSFRAD